MSKKRVTAQQRLLASTRQALAAKNASEGVSRFNARMARLDGASKRERRASDPTPEQMEKAPFVEADVNEYVGGRRVKIGRAYRRQARFETIEGLPIGELLALRRYRRAFDTSEVSPVKSGLDIGTGGGGGGAEAAIARIEAVAFADIAVRRMEGAVAPNLIPILRAVALHDQDFKAVALDRYGSASGNRRMQVKADFLLASHQLAARAQDQAVRAPVDRPAVEEPACAPSKVDPAFLDERGFMRPWDQVAAIIRDAAE